MQVIGKMFWLLMLCGVWTSATWALERVVGANESFEMYGSAAAAGRGGGVLGFDGDVLTQALQPYGIMDVNRKTLGVAHVYHYEGTAYDQASLVLPLDSVSRVGLLFSHFGASGIPWIPEGEKVPDLYGDWETLSISDWILGLSWARQWFHRLDVGLNAQGMYHQMDQKGVGFRSSLSGRWRFGSSQQGGGHLAVLWKNWTTSFAKWESGYSEYSAGDVFLGGGIVWPMPYLYGSLRLGWQSVGLFHRTNNELWWDDDTVADSLATESLKDTRLFQEPLTWLQEGSVGLEFIWNWGGRVRAGLQRIADLDSYTLGAGFQIKKRLTVDYALEAHPLLSSVHRISLSWAWGDVFSVTHVPQKQKASQNLDDSTPPESATIEDSDPYDDDFSEKSWEE